MATEPPDDGWPTHCVTPDGVRYPRIPYGSAADNGGLDRQADELPCHDCGVVNGEFHISPHCEWERCPKCLGQFVSCECEFIGDAPPGEDPDGDEADND